MYSPGFLELYREFPSVSRNFYFVKHNAAFQDFRVCIAQGFKTVLQEVSAFAFRTHKQELCVFLQTFYRFCHLGKIYPAGVWDAGGGLYIKNRVVFGGSGVIF